MKSELLRLAILVVVAAATPVMAACDPAKPSLTPSSRYVVSGGEVYDTTTNLTWSRCSVGQRWRDGKGCVGAVKQMVWTDALKQAKGAWRLPTKDELVTLTSPTCRHPAVNDEVFPGMDEKKMAYWSGVDYGAHYAWAVHFADYSNNYGYYGGRPLSVRLVRTGK
jgi:hypothetical protein